MSVGDYVLLLLIGGYILWLLFRPKKKKCSGNCGCCKECKF